MSTTKQQDDRLPMPSPTLKRYIGDWSEGHARVRVNGQVLRHVVYHTAGDFAWGDGSVGAADLALSILCNYFGRRGAAGDEYFVEIDGVNTLVTRLSEPAYRLHQQFKREVVSRFAPGGFCYTSDDLKRWYVFGRT